MLGRTQTITGVLIANWLALGWPRGVEGLSSATFNDAFEILNKW